MNDADLESLLELSWRRKLTPAEEAELQKRLAADASANETWQTESALNQLLERLPEAPPVSSNFTSLVLQAVARDAAAQKRARAGGWFDAWRGWRWLPRVGVAGMVAAFAIVGYEQHQTSQRAALAQSMVEVTEAVSATGADFMQDVEPIRRMSDTQNHADVELLALMKTQ